MRFNLIKNLRLMALVLGAQACQASHLPSDYQLEDASNYNQTEIEELLALERNSEGWAENAPGLSCSDWDGLFDYLGRHLGGTDKGDIPIYISSRPSRGHNIWYDSFFGETFSVDQAEDVFMDLRHHCPALQHPIIAGDVKPLADEGSAFLFYPPRYSQEKCLIPLVYGEGFTTVYILVVFNRNSNLEESKIFRVVELDYFVS